MTDFSGTGIDAGDHAPLLKKLVTTAENISWSQMLIMCLFLKAGYNS